MKFKLIKLDKVDSTNNYALKMIKKNIGPAIIVSKTQSKGRGRYGNRWVSIRGNLFMSLYFELKKKLSNSMLTYLNCKIVRNSLKKFVLKKIIIKKPNDLLINNKKFCGILQEVVYHEKKRFIVIGIGINISKYPEISNYETGSLSEFTRKRLNKNLIITNIKSNYENNYRKFC